jgi:AMME syndrome candidate gene 1 protein
MKYPACKNSEMTKKKLKLATPEMPAKCFTALIGHLKGAQRLASYRVDGHSDADPLYVDGLFVTWESVSGGLRGCIGSLTEMRIAELGEYAITASQLDTRFPPVCESDIPHIRCKVSILHSMEVCSDCTDWTIGVHGIVVDFSAASRTYRATFLPHVIEEQGWTKEAALEQACSKTGYVGPFSSVSLCVTRYQASVASLTHEEYTTNHS